MNLKYSKRSIKESVLIAGVWFSFLLIWHIYASYLSSIPGPLNIFYSIISIVETGKLSEAFFWTLSRSLLAVFTVLSLGTILIAVSRLSKTLDIVKNEIFFRLTYGTPVIIWALLVVIIIGFGSFSTVLIIVLGITPYFLINMDEGLDNLDQDLVEMGRVYMDKGVSREYEFLKGVVFPQLVPYYKASLRIMIALAFKISILAELFSSSKGLGYRLQTARQVQDTSAMFGWASIIIIGLIIINLVISRIFSTESGGTNRDVGWL